MFDFKVLIWSFLINIYLRKKEAVKDIINKK